MSLDPKIEEKWQKRVKFCQSLGISEGECTVFALTNLGTAPDLEQRFAALIAERCANLIGEAATKCHQDVLEEAIGEEAIQESEWMHLSADYPHLVGVTTKQINDYLTLNNDPTNYKRGLFANYKVFNRDDLFADSQLLLALIKKKILATEGTVEPLLNTVFITSPRGGLELLSIFAYANHLDKMHFPQLLEEKATPAGFTILASSNALKPNQWNAVKRIVFLDDIIASGEQTRDAIGGLWTKYSSTDVKLYSASMCKRTYPREWDDISSPGLREILEKNSVSVYKTISANGYGALHSELQAGDDDKPVAVADLTEALSEKNKFISCAFVWSLPDGESDMAMTDLYQFIHRMEKRTIQPYEQEQTFPLRIDEPTKLASKASILYGQAPKRIKHFISDQLRRQRMFAGLTPADDDYLKYIDEQYIDDNSQLTLKEQFFLYDQLRASPNHWLVLNELFKTKGVNFFDFEGYNDADRIGIVTHDGYLQERPKEELALLVEGKEFIPTEKPVDILSLDEDLEPYEPKEDEEDGF